MLYFYLLFIFVIINAINWNFKTSDANEQFGSVTPKILDLTKFKTQLLNT